MRLLTHMQHYPRHTVGTRWADLLRASRCCRRVHGSAEVPDAHGTRRTSACRAEEAGRPTLVHVSPGAEQRAKVPGGTATRAVGCGGAAGSKHSGRAWVLRWACASFTTLVWRSRTNSTPAHTDIHTIHCPRRTIHSQVTTHYKTKATSRCATQVHGDPTQDVNVAHASRASTTTGQTPTTLTQ